MTVWVVKSPFTLPMSLSVMADGTFQARFPALPGCAAQGGTLDEAVLNLAKDIQRYLEERGCHELDSERTT